MTAPAVWRVPDAGQQAISPAPETKADQGWQDISTAPKDGTRILLANVATEDRGAYVTVGQWQEAEPDGPDYMGADAGFVDVDCNIYQPSRSSGQAKYQVRRIPTRRMATASLTPRCQRRESTHDGTRSPARGQPEMIRASGNDRDDRQE